MPAEITTGTYCSSWFATYRVPSSGGGDYLVSLNGGEGSPFCPCDGFKYRQECRHLRQVHTEACLWNCQWHDGNDPVLLHPVSINYDAFVGETCRNCGAPLVAVRIAV